MISPGAAALIGLVALIIFGPKQLPELAKGLGKALGEFKKGLSNLDSEPDPPVASQPAPGDQPKP